METLPIMPEQMQLQAVVSGRAQLAVLKKLLRSPEVESLICATDSGREGELDFSLYLSAVRLPQAFSAAVGFQYDGRGPAGGLCQPAPRCGLR